MIRSIGNEPLTTIFKSVTHVCSATLSVTFVGSLRETYGSGSSGLYSVSTKSTHGKKIEEISVKKPITVFCDWIWGCFFDQGSYGSVFDMMLVTVVLCKMFLSFFDFCKLLFNSSCVDIFFISGIQ